MINVRLLWICVSGLVRYSKSRKRVKFPLKIDNYGMNKIKTMLKKVRKKKQSYMGQIESNVLNGENTPIF